MPKRFWIATAVILLGICLLPFYAKAQEIYRPVLVKQAEGWEGHGPLCFTSKDIAAAANFFAQFGITWIAEPDAMTVMQGKTKIEVQFTGECATSAKLVR